MKRAETGCARAAEQVFRTHKLMPSGPVAKSRVERTFSTFSDAKDTESKSSWYDREEWVLRVRGWEHKIWIGRHKQTQK